MRDDRCAAYEMGTYCDALRNFALFVQIKYVKTPVEDGICYTCYF